MSKVNPHDKIESKLDEFKTELVKLQNRLEDAPDTLKADLKADINYIETMLIDLKKQISQLKDMTLDKWDEVEDDFKHAYCNISKAIKNAFSKTST